MEELTDEFSFIEEAVRRASERLRRGKSLPQYMYQTVVVLTRAYTSTVSEHYPEEMVDGIKKLKKDLNTFINMYAGYREERTRRYSESLKQNKPCLQMVGND